MKTKCYILIDPSGAISAYGSQAALHDANPEISESRLSYWFGKKKMTDVKLPDGTRMFLRELKRRPKQA